MSSTGRTGPPFKPLIRVLAAAPRDPVPPDLSADAILARFPGLAAAHAVCWSGSIAAGWGNPLSDIDIYAFSDDDLPLPMDETAEAWPGSDKSGIAWRNWMGRYGDVCADVQIWPVTAVEQVLAPYLGEDEPEFCGLTEDLQDLLYRMTIARPLRNEAFFVRVTDLIRGSAYPRSLARALKAGAENQLTDVAGQLEAGDDLTARLTATFAAHTVVDHCLVLAGELCRRRKWLVRRLEAAPECGIGVAEFRSMVLEGVRGGETDHDAALRVARWAQAHLVRVENAALRTAGQ